MHDTAKYLVAYFVFHNKDIRVRYCGRNILKRSLKQPNKPHTIQKNIVLACPIPSYRVYACIYLTYYWNVYSNKVACTTNEIMEN